MIEAVRVTTQRGESLTMELSHPEKCGLLISEVDGISTGDATVNITDFGVLDGGVFNSARIGTRNITISFYYLFYPDIETARHIAYYYFPVKEKVELAFITDHRTIVASGYVESNDTMIFSQQESGQVSILCPDPFFHDEVKKSVSLNSVGAEFEFPFSNESLDEKLICFGDFITDGTMQINYGGDVTTGLTMIITFLSSEVDHLRIVNTNENTEFDLDIRNMESSYGITIVRDDQIVISTVRGNRYIKYVHGTEETNLLGYYYDTISWFQLTPGLNNFYIESNTQDLSEVNIKIEYDTIYGGV